MRFLQVKQPVLLRIIGTGRIEGFGFGFVGDGDILSPLFFATERLGDKASGLLGFEW